MTVALEVRSLAKRFPVTRGILGRVTSSRLVVDDVSLDVLPGETFAVVGESGAGKSTLGRLILRLIEPDAGSIRVDGVDVSSMRKRDLRHFRRNMQMIFQDPAGSLDAAQTVGSSLVESALVHGMDDQTERVDRAVQLLERVGLSSAYLDNRPHQLSGGQLQRVAIARALMVRPKLIVCDEPTAALDVSIQAQVLLLLRDIQREFGVSYLFISHNLPLVNVIAHRVGVMFQGRLVETAATEDLFANPQQEHTKALLAAAPTLERFSDVGFNHDMRRNR